MKPRVSLLFPAYNDELFLDAVCRSILAQSFPDWELLIADDASTDGTPGILEAYRAGDPKRIKILRRAAHDRIEAWTQLYDAAQGRYLCVPGADDVLAPDRLRTQVELMDGQADVAVCHTDVHHIDEEGKVTATVRLTPPKGGRLVAELLLRNFIYTPSTLIRRDVVNAAGGFFRREFGPAQDYNLWLRLSRHGRIEHIPEPLTFYRVHPRSLTVIHGISGLLPYVSRAHQEFFKDADLAERHPENLDEEGAVWMYEYLARALTPPTYVTATGQEERFVEFFDALYRWGGGGSRVRTLRAEAALIASVAFEMKDRGDIAGVMMDRAAEGDGAIRERKRLSIQRHLLGRAAEGLWMNDLNGARQAMDQARTLVIRNWEPRGIARTSP